MSRPSHDGIRACNSATFSWNFGARPRPEFASTPSPPGFFLNPRSRRILLTENGGLTACGQNVMGHTPLKRFGEARELLGTVCWLLDDARAGFVTGISVPVDGGFSASSGV